MTKSLLRAATRSRLANLTRRRWLGLLALLAMAAIAQFAAGGRGALGAIGVPSAPNIKALALSSDPLFAVSGGDKPAIVLALSVEFPTAGAQYLDSDYAATKEYLGYYDAKSCYTYNNTPTETPGAGQTAADYKRFDRSGPASNRMCADAFSGNFLNWASSSAIDMLRLALSGGDRYIDTPTLSILQRAVIPNGAPECFWNSSNFPAKRLQKDGGGPGKYWGAVPAAMVAQAAAVDRVKQADADAAEASAAAPNATTTDREVAATTAEVAANGSVWIANTLNQIFFGTSIGGRCGRTETYTLGGPGTSGALNTDGFFYSRVQVCNSTAGSLQDVRDYGLCTRYPSGNFKPTGSIQKYSDQLRLAAFGYLLDDERYGGVLRAPMKYVGAKTFDENGLDNTPAGGNAGMEWDAGTGVFNANPDGDTTQTRPVSGVINYLNKFGRTGDFPGRYKSNDPVDELYAEALRYLQGLGPTPEAVSGIQPYHADGFPVTTTWADPYGGARSSSADYSCLKSNIVFIGDVNTPQYSKLITRPVASIVNNPPNVSNNLPDFKAWNATVQAFEANLNTAYIDGQGISQTTANPNTPNTAAEIFNGLVGAAYWAHTHDIRGKTWTAGSGPSLQRPGLRVKSFFFDVNEYGNSNNVLYRRKQNQFFTAAKYGGFESDASNIGGKPYNTYGNPFKRQDGTNDNNIWQDPGNSGEASTYYLQSSAREVLRAFDSIFSRASTSARSIAKNAVANRSLDSNGGTMYQGAFDTSDWSGSVFAIPLTVSSSNVVSIGATLTWEAAARLALLTSPETSRKIVMGKSGATKIPPATDFTWAVLDDTLRADLGKLTPASAVDDLGPDRLNYIKGDRSKEGTTFRRRAKLLGDVVNSGIVYSGKPSTGITPATTAYARFFETNKSRTPAVFVGANDGMLHAFNALTGDELFGYIPSWMGPKLAALTSTTYNNNHQAYVDATPAVAEAQVGSSGSAAEWKTVLVSGTGAGGQGVFALDVTNPSAFSPSNVMWEFTQKDDPSMGYVVGRPQIRKLQTSAPGVVPATYRWFALVASGVNNYLNPDSSEKYSDGSPALFLLALDKPAGTVWTSKGSTPNYYKLTVPTDFDLSKNNLGGIAPGLINFGVALGPVGAVAQVYMGDLHGKVWKLDFTQRGATEWTFDQLSYYKKESSTSPATAYPMFIAKIDGVAQPVSMAPLIASGPSVGGVKTAYVSFGTGKYLETADKTSKSQNSFYTLYDNGGALADSDPVGESAISGRGQLQAGAIGVTTGTITIPPFNVGRASDTHKDQRSGWYVDYVNPGERNIASSVLSGDLLTINTLIPDPPGMAGSCVAGGGSGTSYDVDVDTGNGSFKTSTVGLLGEPLVMEISSATSYTISSTTGRRMKTVTSQKIDSGSSNSSTSGTITTTLVAGRLSWRQINNYLDLKSAP